MIHASMILIVYICQCVLSPKRVALTLTLTLNHRHGHSSGHGHGHGPMRRGLYSAMAMATRA